MGRAASATRSAKRSTRLESGEAMSSKSSRSATSTSASTARSGTGATEPRATRTLWPGRSTTRAREVTAMTMALRVPTLRNSWGPSRTGTRMAVMSSPGIRALALTPVTNSSSGSRRAPPVDCNSISASSAASTGRVSPAGDAVARFPPRVAALRICGEPTVRAAWARAGTNEARAGSARSAHVVPAPRRRTSARSPSRLHPRSSGIRSTATTWSIVRTPRFTSTMRSVPPARTSASGWAARDAQASSMDVAMVTGTPTCCRAAPHSSTFCQLWGRG